MRHRRNPEILLPLAILLSLSLILLGLVVASTLAARNGPAVVALLEEPTPDPTETPAKAQYKGVGTINGGGSYGFMLTAIDGQIRGGGGVDKFRIKIWDKATGALVYDNQMGAPDGADPTTAIGGGSIVIHKG